MSLFLKILLWIFFIVCWFTLVKERRIDLSDAAVIAVAVGMCLHKFTGLHMAFVILIGIAAFVIIMFIMQTSIGFWIFCPVFTLGYAYGVALIAEDLSDHDQIWKWVAFGVSAVIFFLLHMYGKEEGEYGGNVLSQHTVKKKAKLFVDLTDKELSIIQEATMEERNQWIHKGNPLEIINEVYLRAWKIRKRDVINVLDPETGEKKKLYRFRFSDENLIEIILDNYHENNPNVDLGSLYEKVKNHNVR